MSKPMVRPDQLLEVMAQADIVALTCPLTPETEGLIGAQALAAMKPSALLINVARGKVVDEAALLAALRDNRIAGAGLDCFHEEPLPASSPFWTLPQVVVTPHSAGETRAYEANVVDLLVENLGRLAKRRDSLAQPDRLMSRAACATPHPEAIAKTVRDARGSTSGSRARFAAPQDDAGIFTKDTPALAAAQAQPEQARPLTRCNSEGSRSLVQRLPPDPVQRQPAQPAEQANASGEPAIAQQLGLAGPVDPLDDQEAGEIGERQHEQPGPDLAAPDHHQPDQLQRLGDDEGNREQHQHSQARQRRNPAFDPLDEP